MKLALYRDLERNLITLFILSLATFQLGQELQTSTSIESCRRALISAPGNVLVGEKIPESVKVPKSSRRTLLPR